MFSHFNAFTNFYGVTFTQNAAFSGATFTQNAYFSGAKFTQNAYFSEAEFTGDADFSEAEFTEYADFSEATFEEKPIFERALGDKTCKAKFSCKADPEDYNFEVSYDSPYKIETEEQEHNGVKFTIPKGAELFDPDRKATVTVNNYIYTQNDRLNFIATKKNR